MARLFDSDSPSPVLSFAENVECSSCGEIFEGTFIDYTASLSVEDLTAPPLGRHECPECGVQWSSEMTGWMFYSEAG